MESIDDFKGIKGKIKVVHPKDSNSRLILADNSDVIIEVVLNKVIDKKVGSTPDDEENLNANASLIAAAPELLREMITVFNQLEANRPEWYDRAQYWRIKNLINKALNKEEVKNRIWGFFKNGIICVSLYEEYTYIMSEIKVEGSGTKTVLQVFDKSGQMVKQWKGMRYSQAVFKEMEHVRQNRQIPVSSKGKTFTCVDGTVLPKEDRSIDVYTCFPSLPRYDGPRAESK